MRAIDGDALAVDIKECIEAKYENGEYEQMQGLEVALECIDEAPTIEPQRTKGEWIERNPQNSDRCRLIECDQCGFAHIVGFNVPYDDWIENRNFCERCGADMRKEGDTE